MNKTAIKVENLSKLYRLGEVGTGTISHDLNRWWAKLRGKQDPFATVGQVNDRTKKAQKGEQVWALNNINFDVPQGEVLGIIGKNGAGKSTLLKLLSKITAPTTGTIKARGRIASLLEVGTGMHPEMTGRENVYLNGTILGMTKREIDQKFDDIMDFAGCAKYADTPVKRYSSGMKVRLGFAVAAFLEPEILIVDEVLAVGDVEFQRRAIGKMQEVSQEGGRTVLFVSHNMSSVRNICSSAIVMQQGEISHWGEVNEAIENYLQETQQSGNTVKFDPKPNCPSIVQVKLEKEEGETPGTTRLKVYVEFQSPYEIIPIAGIIVKNSSGAPVFGTNARTHPDGFNKVYKKDGTICVTIENPNLLPGEYGLSVYFGDTSKDCDSKVDIMRFEYSSSQYLHKQQSLPSSLIGSMCVDARWTILQNSMPVLSEY